MRLVCFGGGGRAWQEIGGDEHAVHIFILFFVLFFLILLLSFLLSSFFSNLSSNASGQICALNETCALHVLNSVNV